MGSIILSVTVLAAGVVLGLLRGGSIDALATFRPRWWGLLAIGFALHAAAEAFDLPGVTSLSIIGSFAMIVALGANVPAIRGAFVAAFGLTMNLIVQVVNGAVPVRFEALTESGVVAGDTSREQIVSVGHLLELETSDTRLAFLGDVIPIGPLTSIISIGDLVTFAGVILIVAGLMTTRRRTGIDVDELFGPATAPIESPATAADPVTRADEHQPVWSEPPVVVLDADPSIDLTDDVWADEPADEGVRVLGPLHRST